MLDITKKYNFEEGKNKKDSYLFLRELDVNAYDLCVKFIKNSNRICFLIKDDKIVFANNMAIKECGFETFEALDKKPFLSFVDKQSWETLALNMGEVVTKNTSIKIKIAHSCREHLFKAVYLSDRDSFSFILLSEPPQIEADYASKDLSFNMLKDRLEFMINYENYKNPAIMKHSLSLIAIKFTNLLDFDDINLIRTLKSNISQVIKKSYCIALNSDDVLFILLNDIVDEASLFYEVNKITEVIKMPLKSGTAQDMLEFRIVEVTFPQEAKKAQKLIDMALDKLANSNKE